MQSQETITQAIALLKSKKKLSYSDAEAIQTHENIDTLIKFLNQSKDEEFATYILKEIPTDTALDAENLNELMSYMNEFDEVETKELTIPENKEELIEALKQGLSLSNNSMNDSINKLIKFLNESDDEAMFEVIQQSNIFSGGTELDAENLNALVFNLEEIASLETFEEQAQNETKVVQEALEKLETTLASTKEVVSNSETQTAERGKFLEEVSTDIDTISDFDGKIVGLNNFKQSIDVQHDQIEVQLKSILGCINDWGIENIEIGKDSLLEDEKKNIIDNITSITSSIDDEVKTRDEVTKDITTKLFELLEEAKKLNKDLDTLENQKIEINSLIFTLEDKKMKQDIANEEETEWSYIHQHKQEENEENPLEERFKTKSAEFIKLYSQAEQNLNDLEKKVQADLRNSITDVEEDLNVVEDLHKVGPKLQADMIERIKIELIQLELTADEKLAEYNDAVEELRQNAQEELENAIKPYLQNLISTMDENINSLYVIDQKIRDIAEEAAKAAEGTAEKTKPEAAREQESNIYDGVGEFFTEVEQRLAEIERIAELEKINAAKLEAKADEQRQAEFAKSQVEAARQEAELEKINADEEIKRINAARLAEDLAKIAPGIQYKDSLENELKEFAKLLEHKNISDLSLNNLDDNDLKNFLDSFNIINIANTEIKPEVVEKLTMLQKIVKALFGESTLEDLKGGKNSKGISKILAILVPIIVGIAIVPIVWMVAIPLMALGLCCRAVAHKSNENKHKSNENTTKYTRGNVVDLVPKQSLLVEQSTPSQSFAFEKMIQKRGGSVSNISKGLGQGHFENEIRETRQRSKSMHFTIKGLNLL